MSYKLDQKLTVKQALFCEEYIVDFNATQAAVRAGYSKKTAARIGTENVQKPVISDKIRHMIEKRTAEAGISAQWVLNEAVSQYKYASTERDIYNKDGDVVGQSADTANALKALALIGKHIDVRAFQSDVQHQHLHIDSDMTNALLAARERVLEIDSNKPVVIDSKVAD